MSLIEIGPVFAPVRAGSVAARREAVTFCCGERGDVRRMARRLFGRTVAPDELAGLTGAPDGTEVEVGVYHAGLHLEFGDTPAHRWRGVCQVFPCLGGLTLRIESLRIDPPWARGQGLGRLMFARQMQAAVALGIRCVRLVAGRGPEENGYYTWPRFGFAGPLPEAVRRLLPSWWRDAVDVLDLMDLAAGRWWWRRHGVSLPLAFDLAPESRSRQTFDRYASERSAG